MAAKRISKFFKNLMLTNKVNIDGAGNIRGCPERW
jgi:hypothetical protein